LAGWHIPVAIGVPKISHGDFVLTVEPLQVLLCLLLVQFQLDGDFAHISRQ
jgi:hypothetical protein